MVARAERQQNAHRRRSPAKRGDILDRNGRLLAYSVDADTIYAVPTEIDDAAGRRGAAVRARSTTAIARSSAGAGRTARHGTAGVRLRAAPGLAGRGAARGARSSSRASASSRRAGASTRTASWRRTCSATSALDNVGLGGIEAAYDKADPRARRARCSMQTDARGTRVQPRRARRRPPARARADHRRSTCSTSPSASCGPACSSTAPTAAPSSSWTRRPARSWRWPATPTFNPNAYRRARRSTRGATAPSRISTSPGRRSRSSPRRRPSRSASFTPSEMIDVSAGLHPLRARVDHRRAPLRRAVVHRRDREVEQRRRDQDRRCRLGAERLGRYVRRFGFGQPTSRDFPARARASCGIREARPTARWRRCRWATRSASRRCRWRRPSASVANGGDAARAARRARGHRGTACGRWSAERRCARVDQPETAATLTDDHGGGRRARHGDGGAGRRATRSPARPAPRTSSSTAATRTSQYNASFVGFVPSREPRLRDHRRDRLAARRRATTAAWSRRRSSSASPRRRCATSASRRPSTRRRRCSSTRRDARGRRRRRRAGSRGRWLPAAERRRRP